MKLESKRLSPVLQEEDFWTRMGATQQSSTFKEKTPPPPVPASIFEVQGGGCDDDNKWDDIDFGSNITEVLLNIVVSTKQLFLFIQTSSKQEGTRI